MHQQEVQLGKAQAPSQNSIEFLQGCSKIQRFVGYNKLYNYKTLNGGVLPYRYIMTTTIKYGFFYVNRQNKTLIKELVEGKSIFCT